jgi:hypothetical protein
MDATVIPINLRNSRLPMPMIHLLLWVMNSPPHLMEVG